MKVIFTERAYDVFTRFIEMKYIYYVKQGAKDTSKDIDLGHTPGCKDHNTSSLTKNFKVNITTSPIEHKQRCRSYQENPDGHENIIPDGHCEECLRCGGQKLYFELFYVPDGSESWNTRISLGAFSVRSNELESMQSSNITSPTWEDCVEKMHHNFPPDSEYNICDCGRLCGEICQSPPCSNPDQYDRCEDCYIYSYIRKEEEGGDCCVCMQNDGVWVKLECNHIIHKSCWNKILKGRCMNLCPLCRANTRVGDYWPY